jgi:transposase-like protein
MQTHTTPKKRVYRSQGEILAIVKEFESSGMNRTAFAKSKGLHPSVFCRWLRKLRGEESGEQGTPNPLVRVRVRPSREPGSQEVSSPLEVVLANGRVVRVPSGFEEETLGKLVKVLEERC